MRTLAKNNLATKTQAFAISILVSVFVFVSGCNAQEHEHDFRHWQTTEGQRSKVRLQFIQQSEQSVQLRREDTSKVVTMNLANLSKDDRDYVAQLTANTTPQTSSAPSNNNWSRFRGPNGLGVSDVKGLPTTWDENTNVRWKLKLPGPGLSSPIVWGDHVYVTCFTGYDWPLDHSLRKRVGDLERHLLCIDLNTGRILWKRGDKAENYKPDLEFNKVHLRYHGYASNTGACDENAVYAFFGADGVFAFSHDGEPLWNTPVGNGNNHEGSGTSLIVDNGQIFVPACIESGRLYALDAQTGKEQWHARGVGSYSTPTVQVRNGRREVLFKHGSMMCAFDAQSGEPTWKTDRNGDGDASASIITAGERIFAVHGWDRKVQAHRMNGSIIWEMEGEGPNYCSPQLIGNQLVFAERNILTVLNAATGERIKRERLPVSGECFASTVFADGKLYATNRDQGVVVFDCENDFEVIANNKLDDESKFDATPAITSKGLLLRSNQNLYCIAK